MSIHSRPAVTPMRLIHVNYIDPVDPGDEEIIAESDADMIYCRESSKSLWNFTGVQGKVIHKGLAVITGINGRLNDRGGFYFYWELEKGHYIVVKQDVID